MCVEGALGAKTIGTRAAHGCRRLVVLLHMPRMMQRIHSPSAALLFLRLRLNGFAEPIARPPPERKPAAGVAAPASSTVEDDAGTTTITESEEADVAKTGEGLALRP